MASPQTDLKSDDSARALRFLMIKAAIFIGIPLVAAAIAAAAILLR